MLTFSPLLSSLMKWVTRTFYGSLAADILTTIDLAQAVRDFDLLRFTGGWHSHYDWPGLECTLFHCLMIHRRLTFSQRLTGLRKYVLSGCYGLSAAKIFTTIRLTQVVRDFNLFTIHRRLTFPLRSAWLREYVILNCDGSSAADIIITTIRLAQLVGDFNLLRFISS